MMGVELTLRRTLDGGSCAECGDGYRGAPYDEGRGFRVMAEVEPGLVEPVNLCESCHREAVDATPPIATDGGVEVAAPEDVEEEITADYRQVLKSKEPSPSKKAELRAKHRHHLVRDTTSRYTVTDQPAEGIQIDKSAEVPDLYCFTCEEWVGLSGVDLRGTPRSRKDAYYLGGPPGEVVDARKTVRNTLADLVASVASTVPTVEDADDAFDFIEGEQQKARERVKEADNAE